MARYREAVCRQCRREGIKLFLKGARCFTEKCAIERRNYPPGQHGLSRTKLTNYGIQLREKQKARYTYGVLEKQFHRYYEEASRRAGKTGDNLLQLLECRLDNVVYRAGFARTRRHARQLVVHGHFKVNGNKVDIPSFSVRAGDHISVRERSRKVARIQESLELAQRRGVPEWLEIQPETFTGTVKALPLLRVPGRSHPSPGTADHSAARVDPSARSSAATVAGSCAW